MTPAPSILIVGADAEVRDATARVLARDGHATEQAASGSEALRMVRQRGPAVVLLEFALPDVEVSTALVHLRRAVEPARLRILLLSPPGIAVDRLAPALNAGADGCLVHPVPDDTLCDRVRELLPPRRDSRNDASASDAAAIATRTATATAIAAAGEPDVEGALRASEARFRGVFDCAAMSIAIIGLDGRYHKANAAACRMLGYTEDELRERDVHAVTHPDDHARNVETIEALTEGRQDSVRLDKRYVRKDGGVVWGRLTMSLLRDSEGRPAGVIGVVDDITERRREQQALRASEQRYRDIVDNSPDLIFVVQDERIAFINPAGVRRLGARSQDDIVGAPSNAFIHPDYREQTRQRAANLLQAPSANPMTHAKLVAADGANIDVEVFATSFWTDGRLAIQVVCRDITRRMQDEEQLRLLETCVAHLNDLVLITDADPIDSPGPRLVYVNEAFVRRTGYAREEVIGRTPRLLQGPRTQRDALDRIRAAMRRGVPIREELINYSKDGEELWLEMEIVPVSDPDGRLRYFVAIERDVTERKNAEAAVRESEERFRLLSRATNDAIWDWNLLTDALWWNEGFETLFGFRRDEIESTIDSWKERIHPDDREWVLSGIHDAVDSGRESWSATYRFLRKDGSYAQVLDRGQVIRDDSGRPVRMIGGMMDATERLALEEQLRAAQRLDALGQLTGGVAHDFNNLLTVILGNAEELAEELEDDPEKQSLAELITSAAQRGADLTHRLLSFSRKQALAPQAVDVGVLLGDIEELLRRTLGEHIRIELAPERQDTAWFALVDRGQLESALLNLCLNARDAMPSGGCLTIETSNTLLDRHYAERHAEVTPGEYLMLTVSDTGSGIAPADLTKVFEPFFTTKETGKGTGLGLAMVYGFIKQSGGHINVYSEQGRGTAVRMYLPRARLGDGEGGSAWASDTAAGLGTGTVLLVEDDALVRRYASKHLGSLGYEVVEAETGPQALEILRGGQDVAVLFTDVVMPGGMSGAQLAEQARELRPDLPVLYCSGYTETTILRDGRLEPGVHLLAKPYRRADLARKLAEVLAPE